MDFDILHNMTYTTSGFRLGPEFTPQAVKKLILYTCMISLGSAITNAFFSLLFDIPGPQEWFSLSWWGIHHHLYWQPLTFLFVHPMDYGGVSLSYLVMLLFNMYILWVMGSDIALRVGSKPFLRLYFLSGVVAGIISLLLMPLLGQYSVLAGPTPAILGLLTVWSFLHPEQELLLFFLIPIKAKWLALGILGGILVINLSSLNFINFIFYTSGALIGYFYALIAWGVHSPFPFLYRIELATIRLSQKIKKTVFGFLPKKKGANNSKIVDIKTAEPDNDDLFIDSMLEKISKYGESSLSWKERDRMKNISKKKSKNS